MVRQLRERGELHAQHRPAGAGGRALHQLLHDGDLRAEPDGVADGALPASHRLHLHHDAALYGGGGLDPRREVVIARLFRDAGYATAIAGKWQVNNLYDEPDVLTQHGFQEQVVWPGQH